MASRGKRSTVVKAPGHHGYQARLATPSKESSVRDGRDEYRSVVGNLIYKERLLAVHGVGRYVQKYGR